jgi:hypothetical protein
MARTAIEVLHDRVDETIASDKWKFIHYGNLLETVGYKGMNEIIDALLDDKLETPYSTMVYEMFQPGTLLMRRAERLMDRLEAKLG